MKFLNKIKKSLNFKLKFLNKIKKQLIPKLKTIVSLVVLLLIVLGSGAGIYLTQKTQDLRQQASGGVVCSSSTTQTGCETRPGCDWTPGVVQCTAGDCVHPGCVYGSKDCTLSVCSSHTSCIYEMGIPGTAEVRKNCSSLNKTACNSQGGCSWKNETWVSCTSTPST